MNTWYLLGCSVRLLNLGITQASEMLIPFALRHNFSMEDYNAFWDGYFEN